MTTAGDGSGTVNSSPTGIACASGISTNCSATFANLSGITLTASPDWKSLAGVFSIGCSGTGSCSFTINGDTGVTVTFNENKQATVLGMATIEYATLAATYANTLTDGFFAAHAHIFVENLTLDKDVAVTFYGGMGDMYLSHVPDAFTTLQGFLEVKYGAITLDSLIIQ